MNNLEQGMLKLKVCGMRDRTNLEQLIKLPPDYIGFIFYENSPRFVGEDFSTAIPAIVPDYIRKVGVFVNEGASYVGGKIDKYGLDFIQLHGNETPGYCANFSTRGIGVIKSFSVDDNFNFKIAEDYTDCCEFFLFDTKTPAFGGSGNKFNWKILNRYHLQKPFILSGGIAIEDIDEILSLKNIHIHALDINSRFELNPGIKDIDLIKRFLIKLKHN